MFTLHIYNESHTACNCFGPFQTRKQALRFIAMYQQAQPQLQLHTLERTQYHIYRISFPTMLAAPKAQTGAVTVAEWATV